MYLFISPLYMFRATQCSSSGESVVSIHHPVCTETIDSPDGVLDCSKHVEKRNKYIEKVRQVGY